MRPFINTNEFRREAIHFDKYGYYTDAPEGTAAYFDYWDEQLDRVQNGYSVGGVRITGDHYFYLNFTQMLIVPKEESELAKAGKVSKRRVDKIKAFPHFWDGDYEYFWSLHIAQYGIDQEEYEALGLETQIQHLGGGKHLIVLKARGKGYSYKNGSKLAQHYMLRRGSKNYAIANEKKFLISDGILSKTSDVIEFLDKYTAWAQPRIIDALTSENRMHIRCGMKERGPTGYKEVGRLNEIIGVTMKDNPDAARGKRGDIIFYEEAGKCPVLMKAWTINRSSVEQGGVVTGIMVAFGTGGTEDADYKALETLFYNPGAHNCIAFENIWDDGAHGATSGFFVPAYQNWEGNMDKEGNSDYEGAKAYIKKQRDIIRESGDSDSLEQYISENPFTPREATLQVSNNLFPTELLVQQLNDVSVNKKWNMFTNGFILENTEGKVEFIASPDYFSIIKFPLQKGDKTDGCISILESPYRNESGEVPSGLYITCHDPYAKDSDDALSLGAAYVYKVSSPISPNFGSTLVASYVGRPDALDKYNERLFLLSRLYNAPIAFENNRGDVLSFAKKNRYLRNLLPEPDTSSKTLIRTGGTSSNRINYGITMNEERKKMGEIYVRDWLKMKIGKRTDGSDILVLHTILDPALLQELISYNKKGNFDRVLALFVLMFYVRSPLTLTPVETSDNKKVESYGGFFDRNLF